MTTKHSSQILIMTIIGSFLFGCISYTPTPMPTPTVTPSPKQMDKSLFTGIPCATPCWHGLEVGKSTEKDAIAVLPSLTFIDQKSVQIYRSPSMPDYYVQLTGPGVEIVANCINSDRECLDLTTANDVLQKIVVGLNYEINVGEAIEYLGNPDYVGEAPIGGEYFICEVYLVWKDNGFALVSTFEAQKSINAVEKYCDVVYETGKVPSNMLIFEARYFSATELNAIMSPDSSNTFFEFSGVIPDK